MTSPTALRALAAQLEQAGWTSVAVSRRGTVVSISGLDPSGQQHSGASTYRGATALIAGLIANTAPQEEQD